VGVVSVRLVGGHLVSDGFGRDVIPLAAFLKLHSLLSARCSLLLIRLQQHLHAYLKDLKTHDSIPIKTRLFRA
jgi:hypothetical protein